MTSPDRRSWIAKQNRNGCNRRYRAIYAGTNRAQRGRRTEQAASLRGSGAGLISGAADDDPTAIATYCQAGARFGYGLCWLMPLVYPLMAVVQQVSARLGRTTGHGIAGNIRRHFPGWFLYATVALLLPANIVAIAADLSVMADALRLLVGGPQLVYVLLFGAFCVGTQIFMRYTRYVAGLKWTTLSLFAYFGAVLMVELPWREVAAAILAPPLEFEARYVTTMVAIFGVALSPYLFFWQASQEVEDQREKPKREPLVLAPEQRPRRSRASASTPISAWRSPTSSALRSSSPWARRCTRTA